MQSAKFGAILLMIGAHGERNRVDQSIIFVFRDEALARAMFSAVERAGHSRRMLAGVGENVFDCGEAVRE